MVTLAGVSKIEWLSKSAGILPECAGAASIPSSFSMQKPTISPMSLRQCPCNSDKPFAKCCQPFISGQAKARTVTQLMRSRYCAFALGGYGDYLFKTWHPESRGTLNADDLAHNSVTWTKLQIVQAQQHGDTGEVEFIAHFSQEDGTDGVHHERSTFVREKGQWLYLEGKVDAQA